jgi:probable HAF family extracellular repeat protein
MKSRDLSLLATFAFFGLVSSACSQSFLYSNGAYTALNEPTGSAGAAAYDINNLGQIVGDYRANAGTNTYAFLYHGGTYTTLPDPTPSPEFFAAYGINDEGQIVGTYVNNAASAQYGFLYSGGHYKTIKDPLATAVYTNAFGINDLGDIVGDFGNLNTKVGAGFLYVNGTYTTISDPLGNEYSAAFDINNLGEIVGQYATGSSTTLTGIYGFLYKDGAYITISVPGALYTFAQGINDFGQVVGTYQNNIGGGWFLYRDGTYEIFPGGLGAHGINDFVQVVGVGVPPVPEPSTWSMILLGFAGLGFAGYCQRRRTTPRLLTDAPEPSNGTVDRRETRPRRRCYRLCLAGR